MKSLNGGRKGRKIKLGNPNDNHLRTYIKNIYEIKLLFPKTLNIELSCDKEEFEKFVSNYKKNKNKIIKRATKKLNNTKEFVILK